MYANICSYLKLNELVDEMFPPVTTQLVDRQEEWNDFQYWQLTPTTTASKLEGLEQELTKSHKKKVKHILLSIE
jgi:hypothetical protein